MAQKILIADDESVFSRQIAEFLRSHGFDAKTANTGRDVKTLIKDWRPRYVLIDMMLPVHNAFELMQWSKQEGFMGGTEPMDFIMMSGHNSVANIRQAFADGAADYLIKPLSPDNILKRLLFLNHNRQIIVPEVQDDSALDPLAYYLRLIQLVLKQAQEGRDCVQTLYNLTRMATIKLKGVRCSIVECVDAETGIIVASSDNLKITGKKLELFKYPELTRCVHSGKTVVIENLQKDSNFAFIKERLKDVMFNSIIVCPLFEKQKPFGVLSVRMPADLEISNPDIQFAEIIAQVASLILTTKNGTQNSYQWRKAA